MPIAQGDIKEYKSTETVNSITSLGGAITATEITSDTLNNLWDDVNKTESASGDTEVRCYYVKNTHATLTYENVSVYINSNTPSTDSSVEIGLGTSAVNGTEQTVADEQTLPTGVTFSTAAGSGNALLIGDIPAGQHKAIWVKRIVSASANAYTEDEYEIMYDGETAA